VKIGGVTVSSTGGDIDPLNFVVSAGVNTAVSECVPTVDVDVIVNATVVVSWAGDGAQSPRASPRWPPTDKLPRRQRPQGPRREPGKESGLTHDATQGCTAYCPGTHVGGIRISCH
jgi:hypothetical protein